MNRTHAAAALLTAASFVLVPAEAAPPPADAPAAAKPIIEQVGVRVGRDKTVEVSAAVSPETRRANYRLVLRNGDYTHGFHAGTVAELRGTSGEVLGYWASPLLGLGERRPFSSPRTRIETYQQKLDANVADRVRSVRITVYRDHRDLLDAAERLRRKLGL